MYHSPLRLTISTVVNFHFPLKASSILCLCLSSKIIGRLILFFLFKIGVNQYGVKMFVVVAFLADCIDISALAGEEENRV